MPRPKAVIEGKHPGGQPTKYRKEYPKIAKEAIRSAGFSIAKIAKLFGVHRDTIYAWMEKHKEFSDGIRAGRTAYDGLCIEKSLVKRARGYRYTEVTQKNIDGKMQTVQKITKHMPPDVAAIKHWQTNRKPEQWADKQQIGIGVSIEDVINELDEAVEKAQDAKTK